MNSAVRIRPNRIVFLFFFCRVYFSLFIFNQFICNHHINHFTIRDDWSVCSFSSWRMMIPAIRFQSMESMESEVLRCQRMTLRVKHYDNSGGACTNRDGKGKEEILMLRDGGYGHRGIGNISRNHKRDIIACFVFVNSEEARDVAAPYPSFGQARNGEMEPKSHHFDPQKSCGYLRDQLLVGGFQEQKNIAILKRKWPRAIRDHHTRKNEVNFRQSFHFGVFFA